MPEEEVAVVFRVDFDVAVEVVSVAVSITWQASTYPACIFSNGVGAPGRSWMK